MKTLRIVLFFAVMLLTSRLSAQVTNTDVLNGAFLNGPNDWKWSQAIDTSSTGTCVSQMGPFTPFWDNETPFYDQAHGRVARTAWIFTDGSGFGGRSGTCRRMEQSVLVPLGSRLRYERHSTRVSTTATLTPSNLVITALDLDSGIETTLNSVVDGFGCPPFTTCGFIPYVVDLSPVWGRKISLRFTSFFSSQVIGGRLTSAGTQIEVDNIKIEKNPITAFEKPTSGQWYNPARSGNGIHLSRAPNGDILLLWYTYLPSGKAVWYISDVKPMIGGVFASQIYKSTWNAVTGVNSTTPAGDVRLEMVSFPVPNGTGGSTPSTVMNLYWDLYSVNGDISGFDGAEPFRFLSGGQGLTGLWYEPALSGWGISIDYRNNPSSVDTIATAFYYEGTEPVWAQAQFEGTPTGGGMFQLTEFTGHGLCPQCYAQPISLVPRVAGAVGLGLDINQGWVDITGASGQFWRRGSPAAPAGIFRLTQP